ncbi:MAG: RluA family pseudouridine synthase [Polyangiaceae bacterium]|nr:RluA family pseudouridine synthase [Polyangiaceae bacterium]
MSAKERAERKARRAARGLPEPPDQRHLTAPAGEPTKPPGTPEDAIQRISRVAPEQEGMRLDRFLTTQLRATSRTRAQLIIRASAFTWEGRPMRSSDRMVAEQRVVLWRPPLEEEPPPSELQTLAEDDQLLVVDKPPLMTVHPTARHHRHTVIKVLESERPGEYLSLVHRLDRETSGVLLIAKSREADRSFKIQLEERSLRAAQLAECDAPAEKPNKTYLAITWGVPADGLVSEPLQDDPSPLRVKMRIVERGQGLASRTGFQVLDQGAGYALVRCELYTGRQHQIRVHLAHLGTPIVGDKLYGPDEIYLAKGADGLLTEDDLRVLEMPRQALHAYQHSLYHPFRDEELEFTSPLPEDMVEFWRKKTGRAPAW